MESGSLQQVGKQLLKQREVFRQREVERAVLEEPVGPAEAHRQEIAHSGERHVGHAVIAQGLRDLLLRCAHDGAFVGRVHRVNRVVNEQGVHAVGGQHPLR